MIKDNYMYTIVYGNLYNDESRSIIFRWVTFCPLKRCYKYRFIITFVNIYIALSYIYIR